MSAVQFLQDLTVVLTIAAVVLLVFRRLGQPPVLGYLVAGLIIGPYTPPMPLVTDSHSIEALAEIGIVFLLFALGVEFNLRRLAKAGVKALICAGFEATLMMALGCAVGAWLGWSGMEGLLLGGVIAVAGTAVVARTLLERATKPSGWEELVAGMLIAEDIIAVVLIAFFSSAARIGDFSLSAVASTLARFGMLLTVLLVTGMIVLPRLLKVAERADMEEVRSLVITGICFGIALLTHKLGYSAALGAFLAGAMSSMGGPTTKLHETAAPFKDVFGAVFFVSVGMLIDPRWLLENWPITLGLTFFVIIARFGVNLLALAGAAEGHVAATQAALAMLPIGEFSFILAQLAQREGLSSKPIYPIAVTLCLGTTLASAQLLPLATERNIGRVFPSGLASFLAAYRSGAARLAIPSRPAQVWMLLRPSAIQIAINLVGISAIFLAAGWLQERYALRGLPGGVWMATALVSLPFLIALVRKAQAVALLLLEAAMETDKGGRPPIEAHPLLTRAVLGLVTALIAAWYLRLSIILLPPWPYAILPLLVIGLTGFLLWRRMARLYALLQVALRESLARGEAEPETAATALSVFADALSPERVHIVPFHLGSGHWAVGRSLSEIGLRSQTGASLLQINRGTDPIPSPGPENRLAADDELLLIGEQEQLRRAKMLLEAGPADLK